MTEQEVVHGDSLEVMRKLRENSIDAIVTDPPYGLSKEPDIAEVLRHWLAGDVYEHGGKGFMGKSWDSFVPGPEYWRECYRVLKPGGHALVFAGTRTFDLMSIAIRFAGFENRDTISVEGMLRWVYGTGFPKSLDVSKAIEAGGGPESIRRLSMGENYEPSGRGRINYDHGGGSAMNGSTEPVVLSEAAAAWKGFGTALKPAWEPVLVFRKPLVGTVAANVQEHGTGALNIDGCRIASDKPIQAGAGSTGFGVDRDDNYQLGTGREYRNGGRWPANVVLDESAAAELDAQSGEAGAAARASGATRSGSSSSRNPMRGTGDAEAPFYGDSGGASRFFYVAKASRSERELGCEHLPSRTGAEAVEREEGSAGVQNPRAGAGRTAKEVRNHHPTVKPIALMRWLVRLVTPPGGIVLDPFCGSGTTLCAAALEGVNALGIEREAEYIPIVNGRVAYWRNEVSPTKK